MSVGAAKKSTIFTETTNPSATVCGLFLGACVLGAAIITVGGNSSLHTLAVGLLSLAAIAGVACLILELPVIVVARFVFIASFFFKGEVNLYKIDEIEDPSGFNVSITLLTGLFILIYDQFDKKEIVKEKVFPTSVSFLLGALFVCAGISVLYGGSTLLGWFALWSFSTSILIAFVVASHFSRRERLVQLVTGIAIGILFTGMTALSQYLFSFPTNLAFFGTGTEEEQLGTQSEALSRVPAFLRTPNGMAFVTSALLPLVIAPLVCRVKSLVSWQKILFVAAAFSGIVAVILSLARGSWISLIAVMALLVSFGWYRLSKAERKTYFVSVGAVLIFACLLLTPFSTVIYERLTADDEGSALIRIPLMETAFRVIEDNPLVGVGLNGYRSNMTKYDETEIFVSQVFPNPVHNVFAHITAEIGIPGGIIFGLLILVVLFECFKSLSAHDRLLFAVALGAAAGIIAFVISAMKEPGSLGSVRPSMRTCFLLFGTVLAVSRIRRRLII